MKLIRKNKKAKLHIINKSVGLIPDAALKHWSMCGVAFYSWKHSGDDFELLGEHHIFRGDESLCKKCFSRNALLYRD